MDKNKLQCLIQIKEGEHERKKFRRTIIAILLYSAFWLCIIYAQNYAQTQLDTTSIWYIIGEIAACILLGGITFFVNVLIITKLLSKSISENKEIALLIEQLEEMEQQEQKDTQNTNMGETK